MTTLLEIAPATQPVKIGGREGTLRGFSLRKLAQLLAKFPGLSTLILAGGQAADLQKLIVEMPDAAMALIQAAAPADAWLPAVFDDLPVRDQITLVAAVFTLTVPPAVAGPFVRAVQDLAGQTISSETSPPASSS